MVGFIKQFTAKIPKDKQWILLAYMIFAAYLIFDGAVYFLSPYSGRISRLDCSQPARQTYQCTVKIYGLGDIHQQTFLLQDYWTTHYIRNSLGSSDTTTCGVSILTKTEQINFIHPYQDCTQVQQVSDQLDLMLAGSSASPLAPITYIGIHASFYRRIILLMAGLIIALIASRPTRRKPADPDIKKIGFWKFSLYWYRDNFLVRLFFYASIWFISAVWDPWYPAGQADFLRSCWRIVRYQEDIFAFPLNYLLCLYPLLVCLVIQALVQRNLLHRAKVSVSRWWILAPLVSTLALMALSPKINCADCEMYKYLMSGLFWSYFDAQIQIYLIPYFLLSGFFQSRLLPRKFRFSTLWVIMPLINGMLVLILYVFAENLYLVFGETITFLLLPLTIILSDLIPALYISRLIYKNHVPAQPRLD